MPTDSSAPSNNCVALRVSPSEPYDLNLTLRSGQFFHWRSVNLPVKRPYGIPCYELVNRRTVYSITVSQARNLLVEARGDEPNARESARRFLALDSRKRLFDSLSADPHLRCLPLSNYRGLTILRQDPYDCLISYIASAVSNIPKIQRTMENLRSRLGEPIQGTRWKSLPEPSAISDAGEVELRRLGFGFRAALLHQTSLQIASSHTIAAWTELSDEQLKEALINLPGVGEKISECVMLFGFGRPTAFPVDVWVARALSRLVPRRRYRPQEWRAWAQERWGSAAGLAQQVLFCAARAGEL